MNLRHDSLLTSQRPDIWLRALDLSTSLTGMIYGPKLPGPNGEIWACGGYYNPVIDKPKVDKRTPEQKKKDELDEKIKDIDESIKIYEDKIKDEESLIEKSNQFIKNYQKTLEKFRKERAGLLAKIVAIPEGEMEWLLHEVGHWVAATPAERALPNYGYGSPLLLNGVGAAREWQAWGFEEIILAPFGTPRLLASTSQQDGVAFDKAGPMPYVHTHYAERQMRGLGIDVEQWRAIWGEWAAWRQGVH